MTKYICDVCGRESDFPLERFEIRLLDWEGAEEVYDICVDCLNKKSFWDHNKGYESARLQNKCVINDMFAKLFKTKENK